MSTVNRASQTHSRGLLGQPIEILHMVVGYLPDDVVKFVDDAGTKRKISQYLVLAQVCKRLRTVVLATDFWQDGFCFSKLLEERKREGTDHSRAFFTQGIRVGGLLKLLLQDENFLNCLCSESTEFLT